MKNIFAEQKYYRLTRKFWSMVSFPKSSWFTRSSCPRMLWYHNCHTKLEIIKVSQIVGDTISRFRRNQREELNTEDDEDFSDMLSSNVNNQALILQYAGKAPLMRYGKRVSPTRYGKAAPVLRFGKRSDILL